MERSGVGPRASLPELLKIGLYLAASLLVVAVFLFTHQMIGGLSRQVAASSRVLARFCAQASFPATTDPRLAQIVSEVIANLDFPIVITDQDTMPRAWRKIDMDAALVPAASIDSLKLGQPISPVIRARIEHVRERVTMLDRKNKPIPMYFTGTSVPVGAVHYGEPAVLARLRWMPLVSVGGVLLLLLLGLWGLTIIRQAEKHTIWVGMAKETAHQLGTPLSSLMGWIELLRSRLESAPPGEAPRIPADELAETLSDMDRDLRRLNKVVQRFSHVGSAPRLELQDVTPVVRDVVQYMRRRMSQGSGELSIVEHYEPAPQVRLNPELFEWPVENLIANALTALDKRPGRIEVTVAAAKEGRAVEVVVADNGKGMTPAERRRAFQPGYTTRRRGWGLGLALARRVVEEYHGGRIFIRSTVPGQGTSVVISLPVRRSRA